MWRFRERRPADEFLQSLILRMPPDDLQQVADFLGLGLRRIAFSERASHVIKRVLARADDVGLVLKLLNFFYFWSEGGEARRGDTNFRGLQPFLADLGIEVVADHYAIAEWNAVWVDEGETIVDRDYKKVFLVHGRDLRPYEAVEQFLHFAGLKVISWSEASDLTGKPQPTTYEVVKAGIDSAGVTIVIWSPDDEGRLRDEFSLDSNERTLAGQARQNVILEAGMAYATAPEHTIFLVSGQVRMPSDVFGFNWVSLNGKYESRKNLVNRLRLAGADVQLHDENLMNRLAGPFEVSS